MVLLVLLVPMITFALVVDLVVATGTILLMLAAGIVEGRRKRYTHENFSQAMDRICEGVEELGRWQDHVGFAGPERCARYEGGLSLLPLCKSMLNDMLQNTVYILERTESCRPDVFGHGRPVEMKDGHASAEAEVVRQGTRLIFRLRWPSFV